MFEVLGDGQAQSAIRTEAKDKHHCSILRDFPGACASLPMDFVSDLGEFKAGSLCPNNPYFKFADQIANRENYGPLIERAQDIYRAARCGVLSPDTPSVEVTLAHTYGEWIENRRSEAWQTHSNSLLK